MQFYHARSYDSERHCSTIRETAHSTAMTAERCHNIAELFIVTHNYSTDLMMFTTHHHFIDSMNIMRSILAIILCAACSLIAGELSSDKGDLSLFLQFVSERQIKLVRYYSTTYYEHVNPRFIAYLHSLAREK